jgi:hypothetical protein
MVALTRDRGTSWKTDDRYIGLPPADADDMLEGQMLAVNASGEVVPASADNTLKVVGRNAGFYNDDEEDLVRIDRCLAKWENSSAADEITEADIGALAYAVDDQTVARTSNGGARPAAGRIHAIGDGGEGVWIDHRLAYTSSATVDSPQLVAGSIDGIHYSAGSVSTLALADDAVNGAKIADSSILPVHLSTTGYRSLAADAAFTIAAADRDVELNSSSGTKAATMTATHPGHPIRVVATVVGGGSYTLACTRGATSGTVTLDAALEGALLVYSGSAWKLMQLLGGATFA